MQNTFRRLMRRAKMLETFSGLAVKEPDLMRLVLQASVAALVNVQSVEAVEGELKRRAVKGITPDPTNGHDHLVAARKL